MLEDFLPPLWVTGEVANWTAHRSGHRYFTLKDDQAQIRCVMFRSDARLLPIDPDERHERARLRRPHALRGARRVSAERAPARGAGRGRTLAQAFEKLRKKLDAEGLLDPRRKRPLPRFPRSVGIVTSTTGAALRDILNRASAAGRRWTRVVVRACRVQGEGAAVDVRRTRSGCSPPRAVWTS